MKVVSDMTKVATVNIIAELSAEKPRYCAMYVGIQKTTLVLITPVIIEISVNFTIRCLKRTAIPFPFSFEGLYCP